MKAARPRFACSGFDARKGNGALLASQRNRDSFASEFFPNTPNPMTSSFWLAAAAYLLPTFPLGYFWHLKTFRRAYDQLAVYRDQVIIPLGLSSMIIQAGVYAWIYPRVFNTGHDAWLTSAGTFGLVFGGLAWSFAVLPVAAKYRMASVGAFLRLETGFTIVQYAVVSPLIALAWRAPA